MDNDARVRTLARMRAPLLITVGALAACNTNQVLGEPRILVSPYYAINELRGDISLQSDPGTGPEDNATQSLRTFGQNHADDDWGIRADIGDGFAGIRFDWLAMDGNTSRHGNLDDDWGALLDGDRVRMATRLDEYRLGYVHPLWNAATDYRGQPLRLDLAAGAYVAHRNLQLRTRTEDGLRQQNVELTDHGAVYPTVRLRATWRELRCDIDYGISPELQFGGDFDGVLQDLELRLGWTFARQDVTVFGGWRRSELPADGHEGALGFDADLVLQGFQLGMSVVF